MALDTRLTESLIQEGLARESINRIQNLRKKARFAVTDRITVEYHASDRLAAALSHHAQWVRNEVLALALNPVQEPAGEAVEEFAFQGEALTLGVQRSMPADARL